MKLEGIYAVIGFVAFCAFIYATYWVAKTVSYTIFYEDMVQQTVLETVKHSALK